VVVCQLTVLQRVVGKLRGSAVGGRVRLRRREWWGAADVGGQGVGFADVAQGVPSGPVQQVVAVGAGEGVPVGGGGVEVVGGGVEQVNLAGSVGGVVEVDAAVRVLRPWRPDASAR
jgi:hypothetical protein